MTSSKSGPVVLDRSSPLPLWAQLLDDLHRRLREGEFTERFPTDQELVDSYAVSRQTAREAVRHLREEGVVERQRGRGTRVRLGELRQPMGTLYSLFRAVEASGGDQSNVVRALDVRTDPVAAAQLDCDPETPLVYLERLRLVEGEPLALERAWLPASVAHPLLEVDFTRTALDEQLARRCGVVAASAEEHARAVTPTPSDCRLLAVRKGAPALSIDRLTRDAVDRPFEWRRSVMRGDRYVLVAGSGSAFTA